MQIVLSLNDSAEPKEYGYLRFELPPSLRAHCRMLAKSIPIDHVLERELDPHITVVYGFEDEDPTEITAFLTEDAKIRKAQIRIGDVHTFLNKDKGEAAFHIQVHSKDLQDIFTRVSDHFGIVPTFPTYNPHITLAYLKMDKAKHYRTFDTQLSKNRIYVLNQMTYETRARFKHPVILSANAKRTLENV